MSKASFYIVLVCLLSLLAGQKADGCNFCVANPKASLDLIQKKMDFCCGQIPESCDLVQPGGPCYVENNLRATASYVFDDWFVGGSECDFDGAEIRTEKDPSHGDCKFKCRSG